VTEVALSAPAAQEQCNQSKKKGKRITPEKEGKPEKKTKKWFKKHHHVCVRARKKTAYQDKPFRTACRAATERQSFFIPFFCVYGNGGRESLNIDTKRKKGNGQTCDERMQHTEKKKEKRRNKKLSFCFK
jgi:hypothetical protein